MEHEINWDSNPEDAYICASGLASVEAMNDCQKELTSDPRFRPAMRVLIDHRRVNWSQVTPEDVRNVIDMLVQSAERFGATYCAMVMGKPVDFGIARMQQHYADVDSELQIEFRVFSTIEDARSWLATLPSPPSPADS